MNQEDGHGLDERAALRQLLTERYGYSETQADDIVIVAARAARVMGEGFAYMAQAVTNALNAWQHAGDQNKEILGDLYELRRKIVRHKPQETYRSFQPQDQGYNRSEFDRWRNQLGRGRGKRKL